MHASGGSPRAGHAAPPRSNDSKDNSRIRLSDTNKPSVFQGMMRELQVLTDKDATLAQGFVGNEFDKDGIATGRLKLLTQDEYANALIAPHDDKLAKFHQMEDQISAINKVAADKISKINLQATYDKSKIITEHEEALAAQLFAHATSVALEASMAVKPVRARSLSPPLTRATSQTTPALRSPAASPAAVATVVKPLIYTGKASVVSYLELNLTFIESNRLAEIDQVYSTAEAKVAEVKAKSQYGIYNSFLKVREAYYKKTEVDFMGHLHGRLTTEAMAALKQSARAESNSISPSGCFRLI
jgi:hypothetical protein